MDEVGLPAFVDILRHILAEDMVRNTETQESLYKSRARVNEVLDISVDEQSTTDAAETRPVKKDDGLHQNYIIPTENGYPGMEAPL